MPGRDVIDPGRVLDLGIRASASRGAVVQRRGQGDNRIAVKRHVHHGEPEPPVEDLVPGDGEQRDLGRQLLQVLDLGPEDRHARQGRPVPAEVRGELEVLRVVRLLPAQDLAGIVASIGPEAAGVRRPEGDDHPDVIGYAVIADRLVGRVPGEQAAHRMSDDDDLAVTVTRQGGLGHGVDVPRQGRPVGVVAEPLAVGRRVIEGRDPGPAQLVDCEEHGIRIAVRAPDRRAAGHPAVNKDHGRPCLDLVLGRDVVGGDSRARQPHDGLAARARGDRGPGLRSGLDADQVPVALHRVQVQGDGLPAGAGLDGAELLPVSVQRSLVDRDGRPGREDRAAAGGELQGRH